MDTWAESVVVGIDASKKSQATPEVTWKMPGCNAGSRGGEEPGLHVNNKKKDGVHMRWEPTVRHAYVRGKKGGKNRQ